MEIFLDDSANLPVVAILSIDDEIKGFRGNRNNFKDLIQTGKNMGILVYVITPRELRLTTRRILGHTFDANAGIWQQQWVPQPHVVYNRIPYRKDEQLPEVQQKIAECLRHPHISLFNPFFFNKWALFEWLSKSKRTKLYIPTTRKLTNFRVLQLLLRRFPVIYLKPQEGKAGRGIMRITKKSGKDKNYELSVQDNKTSLAFRFNTQLKLWEKIVSYASEEYIAQQGIELASSQDRPFDLRILVQKNWKGRWTLTGIGARLAGMLNITTHVPRGGTVEDPEKLLISAFGAVKANKIMIKAKRAAMRIVKQIEKGAGFTLGEMSIDLGVDVSGQLWFFEANAKPMKFDEPHIRGKSLEHLMQYCTYLARSKLLKSKL